MDYNDSSAENVEAPVEDDSQTWIVYTDEDDSQTWIVYTDEDGKVQRVKTQDYPDHPDHRVARTKSGSHQRLSLPLVCGGRVA